MPYEFYLRFRDHFNMSAVKTTFRDGKWWYKPYPFPVSGKEPNAAA